MVAIADRQASPLALHCDDLLIAPTQSPMFLDSYLGTIAIMELLITYFAISQGKSAVQRVETIETARIRLGEYGNDKGQQA